MFLVHIPPLCVLYLGPDREVQIINKIAPAFNRPNNHDCRAHGSLPVQPSRKKDAGYTTVPCCLAPVFLLKRGLRIHLSMNVPEQ
jgi:hypothetical protein